LLVNLHLHLDRALLGDVRRHPQLEAGFDEVVFTPRRAGLGERIDTPWPMLDSTSVEGDGARRADGLDGSAVLAAERRQVSGGGASGAAQRSDATAVVWPMGAGCSPRSWAW